MKDFNEVAEFLDMTYAIFKDEKDKKTKGEAFHVAKVSNRSVKDRGKAA